MANMLEFCLLLGRLKTTKRTGWVDHKVNLPESISDHMYRMSLIAFALPSSNPELTNRVMKMALVHDLGEAIVGDITPPEKSGVSKEDKYKLELKAMEDVRDKYLSGNPEVGKEIFDLWVEYETGESETARICKDLDKFEMILQAHEYERDQNIDLEDFFSSTKGVFTTEHVKSLVSQLGAVRQRPNGSPSTDADATSSS